MIIYTYGHEYPVASVAESNELYDCYICKASMGSGLCRILRIKDKDCIPEVVSWLTNTVDPAVFTDYIESFIFEDGLCIAMKYVQGLSLADKMETEAMPLKERLELFRRILERAVLLDIPEYFLNKCMDITKIMVTPDLTVSFNYPIEDIMDPREEKPVKRITALFKHIFANELERKVPDELSDFYSWLREQKKTDLKELYSRYFLMMQTVEREAEGAEPKSLLFRIWEWLKKIWVKVKVILMFALLSVAIGYLVFTIQTADSTSRKHEPNFDSIGTVVIDKNR